MKGKTYEAGAAGRNSAIRWAALWHSKSRLSGVTEHLIFENFMPKLFRTRAEARAFIEERYGYIKDRKDLRGQPHGWRLPSPIKVIIKELR